MGPDLLQGRECQLPQLPQSPVPKPSPISPRNHLLCFRLPVCSCLSPGTGYWRQEQHLRASLPDGLASGPCRLLGPGPLAARTGAGRRQLVPWDRTLWTGAALRLQGPDGFLLACLLPLLHHLESSQAMEAMLVVGRLQACLHGGDTKGLTAFPASSYLCGHISVLSHQPGNWGFMPDSSLLPLPPAQAALSSCLPCGHLFNQSMFWAWAPALSPLLWAPTALSSLPPASCLLPQPPLPAAQAFLTCKFHYLSPCLAFQGSSLLQAKATDHCSLASLEHCMLLISCCLPLPYLAHNVPPAASLVPHPYQASLASLLHLPSPGQLLPAQPSDSA
jgi:hypothetical protein